MDEGNLEACVDRLLRDLIALSEPRWQGHPTTPYAVKWFIQRYHTLLDECNTLSEDSPARPEVHRKLEEASAYLTCIWFRPDHPPPDDVEG